MSRKKINEVLVKSVEGILILDGENVALEVEDLGEIYFADLFSKFNDKNVRISVRQYDD